MRIVQDRSLSLSLSLFVATGFGFYSPHRGTLDGGSEQVKNIAAAGEWREACSERSSSAPRNASLVKVQVVETQPAGCSHTLTALLEILHVSFVAVLFRAAYNHAEVLVFDYEEKLIELADGISG